MLKTAFNNYLPGQGEPRQAQPVFHPNQQTLAAEYKRLSGIDDPEIEGFEYQGQIHLSPETGSPITSLHELLHVNAASNLKALVGNTIMEGLTEDLAKFAASIGGHTTQGSAAIYPDQQKIVRYLRLIVKENDLRAAYFNSAKILINAYNKAMGPEAFQQLKAVLEPPSGGRPDYEAAIKLMTEPSPQVGPAIDWIRSKFAKGVSPIDIDRIETLFKTSRPPDRLALRTAVQPLIQEASLSDGDRARLESLLDRKSVV